MTCRLLDAEEALGKPADEMPPSVHDTVSRVTKAYEKLKDAEFGKLFSEAIIEEQATGDLLTVKAALQIVEAWSAVAFTTKRGNGTASRCRTVSIIKISSILSIPTRRPAERDARRARTFCAGATDFKLTDDRGTMRDSLYEIDYCMICHEREKDGCSIGLA